MLEVAELRKALASKELVIQDLQARQENVEGSGSSALEVARRANIVIEQLKRQLHVAKHGENSVQEGPTEWNSMELETLQLKTTIEDLETQLQEKNREVRRLEDDLAVQHISNHEQYLSVDLLRQQEQQWKMDSMNHEATCLDMSHRLAESEKIIRTQKRKMYYCKKDLQEAETRIATYENDIGDLNLQDADLKAQILRLQSNYDSLRRHSSVSDSALFGSPNATYRRLPYDPTLNEAASEQNRRGMSFETPETRPGNITYSSNVPLLVEQKSVHPEMERMIENLHSTLRTVKEESAQKIRDLTNKLQAQDRLLEELRHEHERQLWPVREPEHLVTDASRTIAPAIHAQVAVRDTTSLGTESPREVDSVVPLEQSRPTAPDQQAASSVLSNEDSHVEPRLQSSTEMQTCLQFNEDTDAVVFNGQIDARDPEPKFTDHSVQASPKLSDIKQSNRCTRCIEKKKYCNGEPLCEECKLYYLGNELPEQYCNYPFIAKSKNPKQITAADYIYLSSQDRDEAAVAALQLKKTARFWRVSTEADYPKLSTVVETTSPLPAVRQHSVDSQKRSGRLKRKSMHSPYTEYDADGRERPSTPSTKSLKLILRWGSKTPDQVARTPYPTQPASHHLTGVESVKSAQQDDEAVSSSRLRTFAVGSPKSQQAPRGRGRPRLKPVLPEQESMHVSNTALAERPSSVVEPGEHKRHEKTAANRVVSNVDSSLEESESESGIEMAAAAAEAGDEGETEVTHTTERAEPDWRLEVPTVSRALGDHDSGTAEPHGQQTNFRPSMPNFG